MSVQEIIPDSEINPIWEKLNYGPDATSRGILKKILLTVAGGYHVGSGSKFFLSETGLYVDGKLTEKGKKYLYWAYESQTNRRMEEFINQLKLASKEGVKITFDPGNNSDTCIITLDNGHTKVHRMFTFQEEDNRVFSGIPNLIRDGRLDFVAPEDLPF